MYEDFLYEMENGNWYHFEFESDSLTVDDMKRFREYEASTARRINAPVITYVICSSKVKKIRSSISEGINTYRVRVIRLKDNDPGKILSQLEQKTSTGLQREDILYAFAVKFLNNEDLTVVKEAIAMTKLGQMIWDDAVKEGERIGRKEGERIGRKEGERIGQKEASERYSRLILLLSKEKKDDLIIKIASDPEYREEMYKKYGI